MNFAPFTFNYGGFKSKDYGIRFGHFDTEEPNVLGGDYAHTMYYINNAHRRIVPTFQQTEDECLEFDVEMMAADGISEEQEPSIFRALFNAPRFKKLVVNKGVNCKEDPEGTLQTFNRKASYNNGIQGEGQGEIESIHGKTLVFNQLMQTDYKQGSFTASTTSYYHQEIYGGISADKLPIINGHKYFCSANIERTISGNNGISIILRVNTGTNLLISLPNGQADGTACDINEATATSYVNQISLNNYYYKRGFVEGDTVSFDNLMLIDLTAMFGAGNEPSTVAEFEALFPESYYPYNSGTLINFMGMKSAGSVYDELTPDKAVTRIGKVDMGSLEWTYTSGARTFFYANLPDNTPLYTSDGTQNVICPNYTTITGRQLYYNSVDKGICASTAMISGATNRVYVYDTTYTNATAFKNAMDGVPFYYELAIPTETPISPPLNLSYKVADFGTETVDDGNLITDGFNQWDEEWELGWWNYSTGVFTPSNSFFACKNKIPVFPNTVYYFQCPSNVRELQYYGVDGNPLGRRYSYVEGAVPTTFTTPDGCYFVTFYFGSTYGTTYKNDICINLSWNGDRNGEYEPYWKRTLDLCVDDYFTDDNPSGMPYAPFNAVIKYTEDIFNPKYMMCIFNEPQRIQVPMDGAIKTIGYKCTAVLDSAWQWEDKEIEITPAATNTINIPTMFLDYVNPKVTIYVGTSGGEIAITNNTDRNRLTKFENIAPNTTIIMEPDYCKLTYTGAGNIWSKFKMRHFLRLLPNVDNTLTITGDVTKIIIEYKEAHIL